MRKEMIQALHQLPGYPKFEGQPPLLVLYNWLARSGYPEHKIYEVLGPP